MTNQHFYVNEPITRKESFGTLALKIGIGLFFIVVFAFIAFWALGFFGALAGFGTFQVDMTALHDFVENATGLSIGG